MKLFRNSKFDVVSSVFIFIIFDFIFMYFLRKIESLNDKLFEEIILVTVLQILLVASAVLMRKNLIPWSRLSPTL